MVRLTLRYGYPLLTIPLITISLFPLFHPNSGLGADLSKSNQGLLPGDALINAPPFLDRDVVRSNLEAKPVILQLLIFLFGNDWLGADWLYLGFAGSSSEINDNNQGNRIASQDTSNDIRVSKYPRFWMDPGPALLKSGDTLWVWGFDAGSYNVYADSLLVNPPEGVASPDEVLVFGKVLSIGKTSIDVLDIHGLRYKILVDEFTAYTLLPGGVAESRPEQGIWLNISWLTGNDGLLGRYAHLQGKCRGFLRMDFHCP